MRYRAEERRIRQCCVFFRDPSDEPNALANILREALSSSRIFEIDAGELEEEWQFTHEVWKVFRCTDYFGYSPPPGQRASWDSLLDGLRSVDSDTTPAKSYLLIVRHATELWQRYPRAAGTFTEIWQDAADFWRDRMQTSFDLLYLW